MIKHNELPAWLEAFTNAFDKNHTNEKTATVETIVTDLPSFTWENETYYIDCKDNGSIIYNPLGVAVKELVNITTPDEAEKAFCGGYVSDNATEVVASEQEPETNEQNDNVVTAEDDTDAIIEAAVEEHLECNSIEDNQEAKPELDNEKFSQCNDDDITVAINQKLDAIFAEKMKELDDKFVKMSSVISENIVTALSEQQYARQEIQNDAYDLNCQEEEIEHFEEMAQETQAVIDAEHAVDISTQKGRCRLNYSFLDNLFGNDDAELKQTIIDNIENQLVVNEPELENIEVEAPDETEIQEEVEVPDETEISDVEIETVPLEDNDAFVDIDIEVPDEVVEVEPEIVDLDANCMKDLDQDEDIDIIINEHKCPFCDDSMDVEGSEDGHIVCNTCKKEFIVDPDLGKIFYIDGVEE